jgi:drug/metabolite transporter (DMT)-like permease
VRLIFVPADVSSTHCAFEVLAGRALRHLATASPLVQPDLLQLTRQLRAALFTMLILRRRLHLHHWQGMMLIAVGAFVVGLSSVLHAAPGGLPPEPHHQHRPHHDYTDYEYHHDHESHDSISNASGSTGRRLLAALSAGLAELNPLQAHRHRGGAGGSGGESNIKPLLGNLFVMGAQIFTALQFVVEEKSVKQFRMPALLAVGLEGFWGLVLSCAYLPLFLHVRVRCSRRSASLVPSW